MSVSDESMKKVERWMNQSGEISDRVVAALDTLPLEQVREIAKLYTIAEIRAMGKRAKLTRDDWRRLMECIGDNTKK